MKEHYDHVIIGSGLGGLAAALILAKEGYSVCVLEKNNQLGGNLQTFVRNRVIFDTGVHYLGGLAPGQNLYRYFQYLGIIDHLDLQPLDPDGFDIMTFEGDEKEYRHAQGFERFAASLTKQFPEEKAAIDAYCTKLQECCDKFPMYELRHGAAYSDEPGLFTLGAREYIDSITDNKVLRAVLGGSNLLYAGDHDRSPFYVHALSVNSYIQSSFRLIRGGSQITKYIVRELRKFGGDVFKHHEVVGFDYDGDNVKSVRCRNGAQVNGDVFISNADPKHTITLAGPERFRKSYVKRVNSIESTIGAFCLYIVFKPGTFPYMNHNVYHFRSTDDVWNSQNYKPEEWPRGYMISMGVKPEQDEWAENMTVMTYMKFDQMEPWEESMNTVAHKEHRGQTYDEYKDECIERLLCEVEKKYPDIRACIEETHASTPLSYRDYINCDAGGMYGYVKDINAPLRSFISPRTRVPNLYFTGQCLNMHGILGVTISAMLTCSEFLGREYLLNKVLQASAETNPA